MGEKRNAERTLVAKKESVQGAGGWIILKWILIYNGRAVSQDMDKGRAVVNTVINPLNTELNPICHLLALLGAHHILHVSRIRVKQEFQKFSWLAEKLFAYKEWFCSMGLDKSAGLSADFRKWGTT